MNCFEKALFIISFLTNFHKRVCLKDFLLKESLVGDWFFITTKFWWKLRSVPAVFQFSGVSWVLFKTCNGWRLQHSNDNSPCHSPHCYNRHGNIQWRRRLQLSIKLSVHSYSEIPGEVRWCPASSFKESRLPECQPSNLQHQPAFHHQLAKAHGIPVSI